MIKKVSILCVLLFCTMLLLAACGVNSTNSIQTATKIHEKEEESSSALPDQTEIPYNQDLLSHILPQDGYEIADYGESEGTNYSYAVYNMRSEDKANGEIGLYWEIVVLQENDVAAVFRVEDEEHGDAFPSPSEMVTEIDVNFDGENDVLICLGHFGNQGAVRFKCFLATDAGFVQCPSFTDILNPSVDPIDQVIRSQWRNWAASHSWGIYTFTENTFIEKERLTEEPVDQGENEEQIWSWKDEVFIDGEWHTREYFTQEDTDSEMIDRKLYGIESRWGLDQAKWETLFNGGKMLDFSIYGE